MSAVEFLALIEKHPLPWKISSAQPYYTDAPGGGWIVPLVDQTYHDGDLQLAAPAMAAAIIRFLQAEGRVMRTHGGPAPAVFVYELAAAIAALRASLPESLR